MSPRDTEVPDESPDTQDSFDDVIAGFQETVSVSEDSFPTEVGTAETEIQVETADHGAAQQRSPSKTVLTGRWEDDPDTPIRVLDEVEYYEADMNQSATAAAPPVEQAPNHDSDAADLGQPAPTAQDTAVLRRSLLDTPPPTQSRQLDFEEVVAEDPSLLEGGTVLPTLPSRAGARWLAALLTLILTPVTWYLLADAGARLAFADGNPMETGLINPAAIAELVAGLLLVVLIALAAAQSSIGLTISGVIVFLVGAVFVVVPGIADRLMDYLQPLQDYNDFGWNVVSHLRFTGFTGILLTVGFAMVATAWVIFSVRRAGRREEAMRVEIAATNPAGLKARWARKATGKAQGN